MHKKNIWVCILISILILVAAQTVSLLIASAACAAGLPVPAGNILAALALWGIRVLGRKGLKMRSFLPGFRQSGSGRYGAWRQFCFRWLYAASACCCPDTLKRLQLGRRTLS